MSAIRFRPRPHLLPNRFHSLISPRRTKVFSLVKLRLQIGEALGISVSDGTESPFGGIAQEAQAMGYFCAYGDC